MTPETTYTTRAEVARLEQTEAEARDRANEARRRLRPAPVPAGFQFEDASGEVQFDALFQGRRQLVLYHFMYAPEQPEGCAHCTQFADSIAPGTIRGLADHDTTLALVSRAPFAQLNSWRTQHHWDIPWYSASDDFCRAFGSLTDDGDRPRINVFLRDGDQVQHTFQAAGREYERVMPVMNWLDFTPLGTASRPTDT